MKKNIRKVKKYQKTLIYLVVMLLMVLSFIVGKIMDANADEVNYEYQSNNIEYNSTNNSLNATNVKDAIDELYEKVGQCPSGYLCLTNSASEVAANGGGTSTIVKAYTYDEDNCITGDETACKKTICYLSQNKNACPVGTIIDYLVNNTTIVRFHVLHDEGETMTMQTQRNTIYNVAWHAGENVTAKGPDTIMAAIKTATDGWVNVSPINITESTTSFTGGFSAINNFCIHDSDGNVTCSSKQYDIGLIAGTYRARMITLQEATDRDIGQCLSWVSEIKTNAKSCRMFMNNFLHESTYSGYCKNTALCVNDDHHENGSDHNYGYWTMGAISSPNAWRVILNGYVYDGFTSSIRNGARAVVVVNK